MPSKNRKQRSARKEKKRRKLFSLRKYNQSKEERESSDLIEDQVFQSTLLAKEPELAKLAFNLDQMQVSLVDFIDQNPNCQLNERITVHCSTDQLSGLVTYFTTDLLSQLLTDEFIDQIVRSLKACETRLKMVGRAKSSEVALVTRSLISISDQKALLDHPLVLRLAFVSLDQLILELDNEKYRFTFCGLLFELLKANQMLADFVGDEQAFESKYYNQKPKSNLTEIDLLTLPAKALFKNFDAPHVASTIQKEDNFFQVEDPKSKFRKFICQDSELYLEISRDRLCLHSSSMDNLNDSIQMMEKLCGEKIFFLAKILDNTTNHQIEN